MALTLLSLLFPSLARRRKKDPAVEARKNLAKPRRPIRVDTANPIRIDPDLGEPIGEGLGQAIGSLFGRGDDDEPTRKPVMRDSSSDHSSHDSSSYDSGSSSSFDSGSSCDCGGGGVD